MQLSTEDQRTLDECLRGGIQPVRTVQRELILRQVSQGERCAQVAAQVGVGVSTVYEVCQRYEERGLPGALYDKARPGAEPLLKPRERQQIIAMVCGTELDQEYVKRMEDVLEVYEKALSGGRAGGLCG